MELGTGLNLDMDSDSAGNGVEVGSRDGYGDRVGGIIGHGERTGVQVGLVNSTPHPLCFLPPSGFISYMNYVNFWFILAPQAIWT